jgi:hypothetical protein
MKFYIATSLKNVEQHNFVRDELIARGHKITYDWTLHGPVYVEGYARCGEVAQLELKGIADADIVIVLNKGSRGTHVELGAALALRKYIVFYSENEEDHLPTDRFCAFYAHPRVSHFRQIEEVIQSCS